MAHSAFEQTVKYARKGQGSRVDPTLHKVVAYIQVIGHSLVILVRKPVLSRSTW